MKIKTKKLWERTKVGQKKKDVARKQNIQLEKLGPFKSICKILLRNMLWQGKCGEGGI